MRVMMVGTSHRLADLDRREQFALDPAAASRMGLSLHREFEGCEAVVISTCNRTEVYIARPSHAGPTSDELRAKLANNSQLSADEVAAVTVVREQESAIQHLMRVCCGLDAMVLGEPQVLGQVRRAYNTASDVGSVGPVLHQVFQSALKAGKRVRGEAGLDRGRTSVASVAVGFAGGVFSGLANKTVVGLGAGELTKGLLVAMLREGCGKLWVANRTAARAEALVSHLRQTATGEGRAAARSSDLQVGARSLDDLESLLVEADVLACGTGAREPVVTHDMLKRLAKRRRGRPLLVLDVAVPRDVEAAVRGLSNVFLYDLDDLRQAAHAGRSVREDAAGQAEAAVKDAAAECLTAIQNRDLGRLVRELREKLHDMGRHEAERTQRRLESDGLSSAEAERVLAEHDRRLINKLLHVPIKQLHEAGEDAPLGFYAAALRRLFDLSDSSGESKPAEPTQAVSSQHISDGDEKSDTTTTVGATR